MCFCVTFANCSAGHVCLSALIIRQVGLSEPVRPLYNQVLKVLQETTAAASPVESLQENLSLHGWNKLPVQMFIIFLMIMLSGLS